MGRSSFGRMALIVLAWVGIVVCGLVAAWTGWLLVRAAFDAALGRPGVATTRWLTILFLFVPAVFGVAVSRVLLQMVRGRFPSA